MKNSLLILILLFGFFSSNAQTQKQKDEKIRAEINTEFDKYNAECKRGINTVTDFNGKDEF